MNCEGHPRVWHACAPLPNKHGVLVYGGERDIGTEAAELMTSLMVLDTDLMLWYPPAVCGHAPSARYVTKSWVD